MIPRSYSLKTLMLFVAALTAPLCCSSFSLVNSPASTQATTKATTALSMGLFGSNSEGLKGLFQQEEEKPEGPKTVMNIPVVSIKPKPLRFFLQIYIVGDQNSRDAQSWLPRESEDGQSLQIYFQDGTGMCQIDLEDNNIRIERHGQTPSLAYMLQESVMLHGVLDELHQMAFEGEEDVKDSERLLLLGEDVIDKCRDILPARKA